MANMECVKLKTNENGGKIMKNKRMVEIDIMNRNAIISLSMIYALWQTKHKDLLELIRPFILYAVGITTRVGSPIDVNSICKCMVDDFGYKSFHPAIVNRVLNRETSSEIEDEARYIAKKDKNYYLIKSLSSFIDTFNKNRTDCKVKSDAVTSALASYLNKQGACGRTNYTQQESETLLLSFFENRGNSVLLSVDELREILSRHNEIEFFIARFIIEQNEKHSIHMDYLVELVKGYFVTTALYLQAENPNITTSSFKDVTFFLDTRILLAYLGYKTESENESVQETISALKRHGAKLGCFQYNIDEVESILSAYRYSLLNPRKSSTITLEHFDSDTYSLSRVEAAQRSFISELREGEIISYTPHEALTLFDAGETAEGLLNDEEIKQCVLSIKPKYNISSLPDDLQAINTISRIRSGKKLPYIERSRAVFVTTNGVLVSATKHYLGKVNVDPGFPLAITDEDLCVIAWLKDFQRNNELPKMRLLENVLAAITPSQEMMDAYFQFLDDMERRGVISEDESALLRIDHFARSDLMELTNGNPNSINDTTIDTIRKNLEKKSYEEGLEQGKRDSERELQKALAAKRIEVCKKAENEIEKEYNTRKKIGVGVIKGIAICIAVFFAIASYCNYVTSSASEPNYLLLFITIITTVQAIWPFFAKDFWATKLYKKWLNKRKLSALDRKKEEYLAIVE